MINSKHKKIINIILGFILSMPTVFIFFSRQLSYDDKGRLLEIYGVVLVVAFVVYVIVKKALKTNINGKGKAAQQEAHEAYILEKRTNPHQAGLVARRNSQQSVSQQESVQPVEVPSIIAPTENESGMEERQNN